MLKWRKIETISVPGSEFRVPRKIFAYKYKVVVLHAERGTQNAEL